jgi:hypothetical protein
MRVLLALLLPVCLCYPAIGMAEVLLDADWTPGSLTETTTIGSASVAGLGRVRVEAEVEGTSLTLWARDAEGRLIGESHTVPGLSDSEIYFNTPSGLDRIRVRWSKSSPSPGSD